MGRDGVLLFTRPYSENKDWRNWRHENPLLSFPVMAPSSPRLPIRTWIVLPAAALGALILHVGISKDRPPAEIRFYNYFLCAFLVGGLATAGLQLFWKRLRKA